MNTILVSVWQQSNVLLYQQETEITVLVLLGAEGKHEESLRLLLFDKRALFNRYMRAKMSPRI